LCLIKDTNERFNHLDSTYTAIIPAFFLHFVWGCSHLDQLCSYTGSIAKFSLVIAIPIDLFHCHVDWVSSLVYCHFIVSKLIFFDTRYFSSLRYHNYWSVLFAQVQLHSSEESFHLYHRGKIYTILQHFIKVLHYSCVDFLWMVFVICTFSFSFYLHELSARPSVKDDF